MKNLLLAISLLLLGISTSGHAMTYDFAAEGNEHEAGYLSFDSDNHSSANTAHTDGLDMPGGLTITASNGGGLLGNPFGSIPTENKPYFAYMDGNWNQDAGLGVCKEDDGDCAGISDDNQMDEEFIHMVFDEVVNILSLDITGNHTAVDEKVEFWYSLDHGVNWSFEDIGGQQIGDNGGGIADISIGMLSNKTLDYTILSGLGMESEIYLSAMTVSAVPVPAAVWLFGTAMLGLAGFSKRRKSVQV